MTDTRGPLIIEHVKFRKAHDAGLIYPAADTDAFAKLVELPRGTLIFLPAAEDYGPERDTGPSIDTALRAALERAERSEKALVASREWADELESRLK